MDTNNWPKNEQGSFICTKEQPMPINLKGTGRWEHNDVHETDTDSEWYIEYKCHSCGHIWRSDMPD